MATPGTSFICEGRVLALGYALTGDDDSADKHFTDTLDWCKKNEFITETAWTCSDYAEFLIKRDNPGDRDKATKLQDEAIAIAQDLNLQPLLERVLAQREILKA